MTALRPVLKDYLTMRRALGYRLCRAEKLLLQFIDFVEASKADHVTVDLAVAWATLPVGGNPGWLANRLTVVRKFTTYLQTIDPGTEIPPADLLPWPNSKRAVPFLYSDEEIAALVAAAARLRIPLRVLTYQTLIPLLAVTGMRVGEAIRLDRKDVDFAAGALTVWESKFGKSRELPLHSSTVTALRTYLRRRDQLLPTPKAPSFFISSAGTRLLYCNVNWTFLRLIHYAGIKPHPTARPRLHDLRHTFAVRSIIETYRRDSNVAARLPLLSTYLGHLHPAHTYWYLSAAPELLGLAGERLERNLEVRA